ncbi:MAG: SMC-Scp complex subunit ScpB [Gammaproteobacteria bacterium]|nr:SMC-Scp complex subunit ScpB [Gammaproteobacteria bacterium]
MNNEELKQILEAVLFAADEPLNMNRLMSLFPEDSNPGRDAIKQAITAIQDNCTNRSLELKEVGSGYRFQVKQDFAHWSAKLWEERPARYSRATLETLALIAYRQPITRGEIEEVRGVSVSSQIIKSLMERDWIKVVGHRDVPGKPALYATTREFLDYFNLKSLEELPSLAELRDIDAINAELELTMPAEENQPPSDAAKDLEQTAQPGSEDLVAEMDSETESMEESKPPVSQVENEVVIEEPLSAES